MITKNADLFYCEGNSNKEYHIQIVEHSTDSYSVECQWGRVGSTLQTQTKVSGVIFAQAEKYYSKVYNEKVGKGYQVDGKVSSSYVTPTVPEKVSKATTLTLTEGGARKIQWEKPTEEILIPQLLNSIDESEVEKYLKDDAWGTEEKKDGKHQMIRFRDGKVTVFNKKGKEIGYPKNWADALSVSAILDGEAIGETFYAFDLLEVLGEDYRNKGYSERHAKLSGMSFGESIKIVPLAIGYAAKKNMYDRLVSEKREGVVFKLLSSLYSPGRPSSYGNMLKHKFYATLSAIVTEGRTGKRSVGLELIDKIGNRVDMGNVTIPLNKEVPLSGTACEIRYLYAYKGGSLYQPIYLGPRDDVDVEECLMGQVKYKSEEE